MTINTADRRTVLAGAAALLAAGAARAESVTLPFGNGQRPLATYPEKRPMLLLTERPPQLETPFEVFDHGAFTPNDAFFVRYHLAGTPPRGLDPATYRVKVQGAIDKPLDLSLQDLRRDFPAVELAAVNECSGNGRGFSSPRVAGGQLAEGMMGNALWRGVSVKALLDRAGVKATAQAVEFNGADRPQMPSVADFVKGLAIDHARNGEVMLAYEMNGAPLPLLNGYPVRLVVPGWFATYWMKMLSNIEAIDTIDENFWMKTAYRIPDTPGNTVTPTQTGFATIPINTLVVRSFVTNLRDGDTLKAKPQTVRGVAFDRGSGIKTVQFSADGGARWHNAALGDDYGRHSFRQWHVDFAPVRGKTYELACRAVANSGETQTTIPVWNAGGYLRNPIETYRVSVA